jgi:hypothetical protein
MMAHPFLPMTTKLLKKLTRDNRESNQPIISPENPVEFASKNLQTAIESNSQRSETNQSNLRTNNHY